MRFLGTLTALSMLVLAACNDVGAPTSPVSANDSGPVMAGTTQTAPSGLRGSGQVLTGLGCSAGLGGFSLFTNNGTMVEITDTQGTLVCNFIVPPAQSGLAPFSTQGFLCGTTLGLTTHSYFWASRTFAQLTCIQD